MEVILAKSAGFCFGVRRAVEKVYDEIATEDKIYTYGPIIHNEEVVRDLEKKGVDVVEDEEKIETIREGTIIIRSHGITKETHELIEKSPLKMVDATCPFVKRIHDIVLKESRNGKQIIIIGNADHPEVCGIKSFAGEKALVIETKEELGHLSFESDTPICVVSQTTFNLNKFKELVDILTHKYYNVSVVNTICNATEERQKEAAEIAAKADAMIVIGGKNSSNTRKLYEICKEHCKDTYFIQTLDDLHFELLKSASLVGITAGASTPNNIIEEVQNYVRINF